MTSRSSPRAGDIDEIEPARLRLKHISSAPGSRASRRLSLARLLRDELTSITMRISSPLGGRKAEVGALDRAGCRKLAFLLPRRPLSTYALVLNAVQSGVILTNQSRMPYWMHEPS
jgi:hypothetical protein